MKNATDFYGQAVILPANGEKVLRDGYVFTVSNVIEHDDICIIASIDLTGQSGTVNVGYYDFLNHKKA